MVPYKNIIAISDEAEERVEIIEESDCIGGAAWSRYHYLSSSPLIISSKVMGNFTRYMLKVGESRLKLTPPFPSAGIESIFVRDTTIEITYVGLGGGGVGATICRALAEDVLEYDVTDAGGSKMSRGTITLPKRKRVIIGVDDTDTTEEGATWSLAHNICRRVDDKDARYVSHSIVQLYPVEAKTQNCVATVVEFACTDDPSGSFRRLLQRYTLSDETGMAVLSKFDAKKMEEFGKRCKKMEVRKEEAIKVAEENGVILEMDKRGIIGAVAAIPYFARPEASIVL